MSLYVSAHLLSFEARQHIKGGIVLFVRFDLLETH